MESVRGAFRPQRFRVATWDEVREFGRANLHQQKLLPPIGGGAGYALVGSVGVVATSASTTLSPAWGTSENRTAGNLLILWVVNNLGGTQPTTPSGWSRQGSVNGTAVGAAVYSRLATGADAAPVVTVSAAGSQGMLAEFSGNSSNITVNQHIEVSAASSPQTGTNPAIDAAAGELVIYMCIETYTTAATKTNTVTINNGATANDSNNNSTSTVSHYNFGWGITTSNAVATAVTLTYTTTKLTQALICVNTFLVQPPIPLPPTQLQQRHPRQGVKGRVAAGRF